MALKKYLTIPYMSEATSVKVVLTGDSGVGKTAIVRRYVEDRFEETVAPTIGVAFQNKAVTVGDKTANLVFWDTAGQEMYRALAPQYYRDATLALVVLAVNEESSVEGACAWIEQLKENQPSAIVFLVGNKIDVEDRTVSVDAALKVAQNYNLTYMETSAKNGQGVTEVFEEMVRLYFEETERRRQAVTKPANSEPKSDAFEWKSAGSMQSESVNITEREKEHKKKCC